METIWKCSLKVTDSQILEIPEGGEFLHVAMQGETPCVWVGVYPRMEKVERTLLTFGTGYRVPDEGVKYVGTYQLGTTGLVFHVFEKIYGNGGE